MSSDLSPVLEIKQPALKYILYVVLGILCVNVLILDIYTAFNHSSRSTSNTDRVSAVSSLSLTCPQNCVDLFTSSQLSSSSSAINSTSATATPTSAMALSPTPVATATPTTVPPQTLKEVFIPLGYGFGNASDWTTITGIGASINLANYGSIASVFFEVTVRIPTGNQTVYVRLYNANSYQSIANSDVTLSGGTPTILVSKPIILIDGNNLYQIQMKTQLQYLTYIDQARIRIIMK